MTIKSYALLKTLSAVVNQGSLTAAAAQLHLTKGAVSQQIKQLENELGFPVFDRSGNGLSLTIKGQKVLKVSESALQHLDDSINRIGGENQLSLTIGLTTYFASRWLSPVLMRFTSAHPEISIRLQPTTETTHFSRDQIDVAIRWGNGQWTDAIVEPLMPCAAFPTAGSGVPADISNDGLARLMQESVLLHDHEKSTAWAEWHQLAGFTYAPSVGKLVIPDPNVRVQAVIDGQGIALNDALVQNELNNGNLVRLSTLSLDQYGYFLAYPDTPSEKPALEAFRQWILSEAENTPSSS